MVNLFLTCQLVLIILLLTFPISGEEEAKKSYTLFRPSTTNAFGAELRKFD